MWDRGRKSEFSLEEKVAAVRMVTDGGRTVLSVANEYGELENTVLKWKRPYQTNPEQAFSGSNGETPPDEMERMRHCCSSTNALLMRRGQTYVAIYDVLINVTYVLCAGAQSIGTAVQPLIATFFTERDAFSLKCVLRMSYILAELLCVFMAGAAFIFARPIAVLFGFIDGKSLALCARAVRIACVSVLPAGVSIILCADGQTRDREWLVMGVCLLRNGILLALFAYLLNATMPATAASPPAHGWLRLTLA